MKVIAIFGLKGRCSKGTIERTSSLTSVSFGISVWRRANASRRWVRVGGAQAGLDRGLDLAPYRERDVLLLVQKIEIAQDDRQQIVEIMGNAAGQLADRLHLLRLLQLLFQQPPFCNVLQRAIDGDSTALGINFDIAEFLYPGDTAIGVANDTQGCNCQGLS